MCCGSSSLWVRIALALIIIGFILETVGFATPTWMFNDTSGEIRIGLWSAQTCSGSVCTDESVPTSYKNDKFRATQAMEILAYIVYIITPFLIGVYVFSENARNQKMVVCCMVACFLIGALIGIGFIIWLIYVQSQSAFTAGYSMGLTIVGGILAIFAGLLFIPEIDDEDYDDEENRLKSRGSTPSYDRKSRSRKSRQISVRAVSPESEGSSRATSKKTYDSMPMPMDTPNTNDSMSVPMSPSPSDRISTGKKFRPPTFNDVSNITLQRDRVYI